MTHAPLKMISSMATRELLVALAARCQQHTGQPVKAEAAGGVDVARRVEEGEVFDVVVLASNTIDKLIASGKVLGPRTDIVESGVAIAVRSGARRVPVTTEDEVRRAVLAAASLSYSTGASGIYLERLFERWGILAQVRPRIVVPPPGTPVGSLVAEGRAELGFQQLPELMNLPGIDVLGPLPPAIQSLTIFSGAVCAASAQPAASRLLVEFLASPATDELKRAHGMAPPR
jgi:molybdate transport system substrate-binding protein